MLDRVKGRVASLFRLFTVILVIVSVWTAYENVFSDDTAVRAQAGELARKEAGCGDKCKLVNMHGSRGMIEESIEYDFEKAGQLVVTCRRANVIAGEYACVAVKR